MNHVGRNRERGAYVLSAIFVILFVYHEIAIYEKTIHNCARHTSSLHYICLFVYM